MFGMIPVGRRDGSIFGYLDEIEKSFFNNISDSVSGFRCDVSDKGESYLLEAEMPGFNKEDIEIKLDGDLLTISASHNVENDEKDKEGNYIRRERRYGSYSRSFDVSGIDIENVSASYNNGVLELSLPKVKEEVPEVKKIEIK